MFGPPFLAVTLLAFFAWDPRTRAGPSEPFPSSPAGRGSIESRQDVPTCHSFEADTDHSAWNFTDSMPIRRRLIWVDCNSTSNCTIDTSLAFPYNSTWSIAWRLPDNETLNVDIANFNATEVVGPEFANEVIGAKKTSPGSTRANITNGNKAYFDVSPSCVQVPGVLKDCGNEREYNVVAHVPKIDSVSGMLVFLPPNATNTNGRAGGNYIGNVTDNVNTPSGEATSAALPQTQQSLLSQLAVALAGTALTFI